MKKFNELKIETQTIKFSFSPPIINLFELFDKMKDDKYVLRSFNEMKNQRSFYVILEKEYFCNLTRENICILGCVNENYMKIPKMILDKVRALTNTNYIIYGHEQVLTNLRHSFELDFDLTMIQELFKGSTIFYTSYNPSKNSNLFIEYSLGKINGKIRKIIFTLTRKGSLKISGRKHVDIKLVYDKFADIMNSGMYEAVI